jgi:non-specific serine/threonine protein kinase
LCQTTLQTVEPIEPPPDEALAFCAMEAPPITGAEYLNKELLRGWWIDFDTLVRSKLQQTPGGLSAFLESLHPSWHAIGRVTFHLAENKRDPAHPFAFMATYTSGIGANGKALHLPLIRARQEYVGAQNKATLLKLLKPISDAEKASSWVAQLVASQDLYRPLAWTPREAYQLLQSIPVLESCGIVVRVPDWWKARRPSRPQVSVKIGSQAKTKLGVDAMLDFDVNVTLENDTLSEGEIDALMNSDQNLVQLRGQWVEVDRNKLSEALQHWRRVEQFAEDGISFVEGMRMLSGFNPASEEAAEADEERVRTWSGVQAGDWLEQTLSSLREPASQKPPETLRATLRPYQEKGYAWLRFLSDLGLGACLADDMGLGKTVQVIALLLHRITQPKRAASLLIVPASLIPNWRSELSRFAPSIKALIAHSSENDVRDPALPARFNEHDLVITTYAMVSRLEALTKHEWDVLILDEAQAIKNAGARQSKIVKQLKSKTRIALSGTPIENRLSDLWSLFDFLNPGLLGAAKPFAKYVKEMGQPDSPQGYAPLRKLIQPYILRRLKTDKSIISDLPDKTELKAYCSLTKAQAALYQQAVTQMERELEAVDEGIKRQGLVLTYLMRFKQICNHPAQCVGDGDWSADLSGKFARIEDICAELASRQQRALVFTQFREMTDPLAEHLKRVFGSPGLVLHGSVTIPKRKQMVEQFQKEDGPPFFVLSIKAGGTGLNLTAAANVIHFDRWWNPAVENQATDRAFRIGQKQNVLVHKFICRGTVEERIDAMIEEKIGLSKELLGTTGAEKILTDMNNSELLKFVSLDINRATSE